MNENSNTTQPEKLYGYKQIAEYMKVSVSTLKAHIKKYKIPIHRFGNQIRAYKSELDKFEMGRPATKK